LLLLNSFFFLFLFFLVREVFRFILFFFFSFFFFSFFFFSFFFSFYIFFGISDSNTGFRTNSLWLILVWSPLSRPRAP